MNYKYVIRTSLWYLEIKTSTQKSNEDFYLGLELSLFGGIHVFEKYCLKGNLFFSCIWFCIHPRTYHGLPIFLTAPKWDSRYYQCLQNLWPQFNILCLYIFFFSNQRSKWFTFHWASIFPAHHVYSDPCAEWGETIFLCWILFCLSMFTTRMYIYLVSPTFDTKIIHGCAHCSSRLVHLSNVGAS